MLKLFAPARIALLYGVLGVLWGIAADYVQARYFFGESYGNADLLVELLFFIITGYLLYKILLGWQQSQLMCSDMRVHLADTAKIQRLTNLYAALSQCNQSIVRCTSEQALFQQICRHAVEYGGMSMAWIGLIEAGTKSVKPVARYGKHTDYLEKVTISASADNLYGKGPIGQAISNDQAFWCADFPHNPHSKPWHEQAARSGWLSAASIPLHRNKVVIGVFSLFSSEANAFDEIERDLLLEMAMNIDFAITGFDKEAVRKHAEQALRTSQEYLQTIIESEPECIKTVDSQGRLLDMNKVGLALLEADSVGQINQYGLGHFVVPEYRDAFHALHQRVINGESGNLEFEIIGLKGTRRWLETYSTPLHDDFGNNVTMLSITRDITERKRNETQLRLASQVFEQSREGFVITDADKKIILVNNSFTTVTGYTLEEARGQKPSQILSSGLHDENYYHAMWDAINSTGYWQGEIWNRRKNGEVYPELLNISAVTDTSGKITNYIGVFTDLSALKASEQQLEFLAHHDPLTHLPNRMLLLHRLQHGLDLAQREQKLLALMMLDLDRFKNINDSFGHLAGDELLQQVAGRLTARLRKMDTVARLGGDEFTVVLEDIHEPEDAARVAKDIITDLIEPFYLSSYGEVRIGVSIGISLFPQHGDTPEMLLQQADTALYLAKSQGRGRYAYFSDELTVLARKRMELESRLRKAITQGELCVYYQPQIDIATDRIVGAEALVRWQDPLKGLVFPIHFIPLAEESSLILAIGEWVMREACRQGKQWLDEGLPDLNMAVNVSPHQFMQCDLGALVTDILAETGFPAKNLEIELTETALLEREEDAIGVLNKLRSAGVHLAIDDFGTGYSSLAYLKRLPLDVLKIDKSFIDDIPNNKDDMEIATTIIAISDRLGFKVLAEGVETPEQLRFLTEQGCDLYQGYLKSEAVSATEFAKLLLAQSLHAKHNVALP